MRKLFLAVFAALVAFWAQAIVVVEIEHDTSGCRPGYWTSDFAAAKAMADAQNIPLLSFWGYENCAHCAKTKSNGLDSDKFKAWVAKKPIILVYTEATDATRSLKTDVKIFTRGDNPSSDYPFMRCYWKKADGTLVSKCFSGNKGQFPYTTGILEDQLVGTLDMYFGSWTPTASYNGGYFSVTNRPKARLEAVAGVTKYVDIPLYRTEKTVATNKIQVASGSKANVVWGANVLKTTYRYTLPTTAKAGTSIALKLYAADGTTVKSTSAINVVSDPGNHISNPKFVGESFTTGEWTMDLDAALAKAKATATAKVYTLAVVGGDMWCPHCMNLRTNLLEKTEFKNWATGHNVNLVCIDMPQKDKTTATLLTRDESAAGASGAAYLSRKMISDAKAQEIFNRNKTLSGTTWRPKSSTAARLSNPTILLINSDKTVAGRFYSSKQSNGTYPITETINRLNELLLLDGSNDDLDSDPVTTTQTLAVEETGDGELQVNANVKYYKLTNVPAGKVKFSATQCARALTLAVCEYTSAGGLTTLATGNNAVTVTFTTTANKYLKVSGFTPATQAYGTQTACSFTLGSTVVLVPAEKKATYTAKSATVTMEIVKGTKYKLTGFATYPSLTSLGSDLYQATATATVSLGCRQGTTVSFQKWVPGTIKFASASAKVMESVLKGTVNVLRAGGSSGAAQVTLAVDTGSLKTKRVTISPTTLSWADGASAAQTVTYTIKADETYHADESFAVKLTAAGTSAAPVASPATFTLTVSDTGDPAFAKSSYSLEAVNKMQFAQTFPVNNILENGAVTLTVGGTLPRGVTAVYQAASKTVLVAGTPKYAGTYSFTIAVTEARAKGAATGKASTFTMKSIAAADLKTTDSVYNAVLAGGGAVLHAVPLFGTRAGQKVLAGSLEVKVTKNNKIYAKYIGNDKKISFSGYLQGAVAGGTLAGTLTKSGATLAYSIDRTGRMTAKVSGVANDFGATLTSNTDGTSLLAQGYQSYAAFYTVTLPADTSTLTKGGEIASTGTGYVILNMDKSTFVKNGKVSYAGVFADGSTFSGSTYFIPGYYKDGDGVAWGLLPIVASKSTGSRLSVALLVRSNAASVYTQDPQVVIEAPGVAACTRSAGVYHELDVYGGVFVRGMDIASCCRDYYETESFRLACDTAYFAATESNGKLTKAASGSARIASSGKITITNDDDALATTLRINSKTGVVTGTTRIQLADGTVKKLTVRGVMLPGWVDCGCGETVNVVRPVVSATAFFKEKRSTGRVTRGLSLDLTDVK